MFGSLGVPELLLIFVVVLIVFGPRKIPEIGRTLGKALGEFRKATDDLKSTIEREVRLEELKSIRTPSMESFVTPVESVSRPAPFSSPEDRRVTDPSPEVVESSSRRVDENAPSMAAPAAITDDQGTSDVSTTRRLDDSTT